MGRAARFLRARGKSIPPFPAFQGLPELAELAELAADAPIPSLPTTTRELETFRVPPGAAVPQTPAGAPLVLDLEPEAPEPPERKSAEASGPVERAGPVESLADPSLAVSEPSSLVEDLSHHATFDDELTLDPQPVEDRASGRERRTYVRTLADTAESDRQALARIAIRSWIGMVEAASIEWLTEKQPAREVVRDLLVDMLFAMLLKILDPKDIARYS